MENRIEENIPILGRVSVNFVHLASKIYNLYLNLNEIERQKSSPHLGLISKAFQGINHSRYDYLILQCVISEIADNSFKGTTNAQGSIIINGEKFLGNDLIKSWFLLSNFGHCRFTIGDEKTLLLKTLQSKGFKSKMLRPIKDEYLKAWSEDVINNFDYVNFHYVLSAYRIYKSLPRKLEEQNEFIDILKLLLLDSHFTAQIADSLQIEKLKSLYRNIRNLSIISLDSQNSSLPFTMDILPAILSFDSYESRYDQTQISEIFDPILSLLYDNLYLSKKSQTYQRSYEVESLDNISNNFKETIKKAIYDGLSNSDECNLNHFLRVELHTDYIESSSIEVALRKTLTVKRELASVEASLDHNPFTSKRIMDFYTRKNTFQVSELPKYLWNIAGILEKHIEGTVRNHVRNRMDVLRGIKLGIDEIELDEDLANRVYASLLDSLVLESGEYVRSKNHPTFKEILWAVLRFYLKKEYYFDIDPHVSKEYDYIGIIFKNKVDELNDHIEKAISDTNDNNRIHELRQLQKSTTRKFDGYVIACLARINIYDYSKAPEKRIVTDIDSLVLKFNENQLILEFHESKNTKKPVSDAKKDLRKKFTKVLSSNAKGYRVQKVTNFGAKVVIKH